MFYLFDLYILGFVYCFVLFWVFVFLFFFLGGGEGRERVWVSSWLALCICKCNSVDIRLNCVTQSWPGHDIKVNPDK